MRKPKSKTFCDICGEELTTWPNKFETSFYKLSSVCDTCSRSIDHTIEKLNQGHPEVNLPAPSTPTPEEIGDAFRTHCNHTDCENCIFSGVGTCETRYTYLVLMGKKSLVGSFDRED